MKPTLGKEQIVEIAKTLNRTATPLELALRFGVSVAVIHAASTSLRKNGVQIPKRRNYGAMTEALLELKTTTPKLFNGVR